MSATTFTDNVTPIPAAWLQAVNDLVYVLLQITDGVALTEAKARAALKTAAGLTGAAGTNTITATSTPAPTAYATYDSYILIPAATNTGATTLNIAGVGAKNVFANGAACVGGELIIGVPALFLYDGTQFNVIGLPALAATQADQETSTSLTKFVTPGRQQYHPSSAKAWVRVNTAGGVSVSYGVSSVTDVGVGQAQANWATAFSTANYCAMVTLVNGGAALIGMASSLATGSAAFDSLTSGSVLTDPGLWHIVAFGDQ